MHSGLSVKVRHRSVLSGIYEQHTGLDRQHEYLAAKCVPHLRRLSTRQSVRKIKKVIRLKR